MRNKSKSYSILLLGIALLLASLVLGCQAPSPPPDTPSFDTYTNHIWGYTISYPNDWDVDSAEPEHTKIHPPPLYFGMVTIEAEERSVLPIRDRVQIGLEVGAEFWDSFTVLDSKEMEGMWDWYTSCDYYWGEYDIEFHEETYFKDTAQYSYRVIIDFEKADYDVYPLSEIAETFTLLQEEAPPPAEPTTYVLSTNVSPSEAGSVSPSGGEYEENTQVTLTATVASGYTFDYWGGDTSGSSTTVTLTMDSAKSVTAHFKVIEPEPIRFSGHGDDVTPKFTLEQGITIITMTHDGSSNFVIKLLNDKGDWVDLLVNEIGAFEGSKAIGVRTDNIIGAKPGTHLLDVTADSNWEVVIEQPKLTEAKSLPQTFQGSGCGVSSFFTLNEGLTTFTMTHDGESNFIVTLLGNDGRLAELLVNEIGSYDGKKAVGVKKDNLIGARPGIHVLSVEADGNWFVSVSQ